MPGERRKSGSTRGGRLGTAESERVVGVTNLIELVQQIVGQSGDPDEFDAAEWVAQWKNNRSLPWRATLPSRSWTPPRAAPSSRVSWRNCSPAPTRDRRGRASIPPAPSAPDAAGGTRLRACSSGGSRPTPRPTPPTTSAAHGLRSQAGGGIACSSCWRVVAIRVPQTGGKSPRAPHRRGRRRTATTVAGATPGPRPHPAVR